MVVPADAARQKVVIAADADRQQAVLVATGVAEATVAKMTAEAKGIQAILDGKAAGYRGLVEACSSAQQAAALLLIEKFQEIAQIQAQAISKLPIEKIFVWDSGGANGGLSNFGQRIMGALPPMQSLAKMVGLELPDFLGKLSKEAAEPKAPPTAEPPTAGHKA
jgi:flotillin